MQQEEKKSSFVSKENMIISMIATTIYFGPLVDGDEGLFCCKREFWERDGIINLLTSADSEVCHPPLTQ